MKLKFLALSLVAATASFFGGCASPAQSNAMVPPSLGSVTKHAASIDISVTGGSPTSAAGASQISDTDFGTALSEAIRQSGLFASVIPTGQSSDYHLDVAIVRLQQPLMGFSMTATLETNWTLIHLKDHTTVWRKAITASYTAKAGDALAGVTRLRLATEGAARESIRDAVTQISALALP